MRDDDFLCRGLQADGVYIDSKAWDKDAKIDTDPQTGVTCVTNGMPKSDGIPQIDNGGEKDDGRRKPMRETSVMLTGSPTASGDSTELWATWKYERGAPWN